MRWFRRLRYRWQARWAKRERCETCGRYLRASQVVEITETWDLDDPRDRTQALGGTGVSAIYCKRHGHQARWDEIGDRLADLKEMTEANAARFHPSEEEA